MMFSNITNFVKKAWLVLANRKSFQGYIYLAIDNVKLKENTW